MMTVPLLATPKGASSARRAARSSTVGRYAACGLNMRLGAAVPLLLVALSSPTTIRAQGLIRSECQVLGADTLAPSAAAFMLELLVPQPSARTPRFDDYTAGSYHVAKVTLPGALANVAVRCGSPPTGLIVVGPVGPLWSYYVLGFFRMGDSTRLSAITMPHARIVTKSTSVLSGGAWDSLLARLQSSGVLRPGLPPCSRAGGGDASLSCEFSYDVQVTTWGPTLLHWHASLGRGRSEAFERFLAPINALLQDATPTYTHPGIRR